MQESEYFNLYHVIDIDSFVFSDNNYQMQENNYISLFNASEKVMHKNKIVEYMSEFPAIFESSWIIPLLTPDYQAPLKFLSYLVEK